MMEARARLGAADSPLKLAHFASFSDSVGQALHVLRTLVEGGRLTAPITDDRGYTAAYGSYQGVGGGVSRPGRGYDGAMRALTGVRLAEDA